MQIQPCTVRLKDGREVLLRSPEAADAQALLDYMRVTSGETDFMARYPEECQATVEQETGFIEARTGHPQNFMIVAMLSGELVGGCSVMAVSGHIKTRHRGSLGISVEQKAWGGLGTAMIEAALRQALLGALGSFVDIRMIHEQLMGTQVLFLIPAFSYQAEALCEIAKELPKFSSGAVIAAKELPAHEERQVLCEGKLGIQSVLEMAGFAGAPLRVGGDEA